MNTLSINYSIRVRLTAKRGNNTKIPRKIWRPRVQRVVHQVSPNQSDEEKKESEENKKNIRRMPKKRKSAKIPTVEETKDVTKN